MASHAVENNETPLVEKEVEDVDAPKVVDTEENEVVENGNGDDAEAAKSEAPENGSTEAEPEVTSTPTADGDEVEEVDEAQNGDSTDAPAEAVKRKIPADADATDAVASEEISLKKSKLEEAAKENGDAPAEAEVVA